MNTEQTRADFEAAISDYFERLELNYNPDFTGRIVSSKYGDHFLYRSEHTRGMQLGYEACCKKQEDRIAELEAELTMKRLEKSTADKRIADLERQLADKQFKIDALMLEYCPDDMTPEQVKEWGESQLVADKREFVVELPQAITQTHWSYGLISAIPVNKVIAAIEAAGGRVKDRT